MTLSVIEQKLLNKKIKEFNEEIGKGVEIIINAFKKYQNFKENTHSLGVKEGFKGNHEVLWRRLYSHFR